ncbi:MAG TPA: hypothetical protein VK666_17920 [Chryseolinea sp.]|jgi:hypothetical protein|nr:hypothetical protein [Chryseolinea sp.]
MTTFTSARSNTLCALKNIFVTLCVVLVPAVYSWVFSYTFDNRAYPYVAACIFLSSFIREASRNRLSKMEIDNSERRIIFFFSNLFSRPKTSMLSFNEARIEINESKSVWRRKSLRIFFLKNKMEVFEVSKNKDGFTVDSLEEIRRVVENIPLPVSE